MAVVAEHLDQRAARAMKELVDLTDGIVAMHHLNEATKAIARFAK